MICLQSKLSVTMSSTGSEETASAKGALEDSTGDVLLVERLFEGMTWWWMHQFTWEKIESDRAHWHSNRLPIASHSGLGHCQTMSVSFLCSSFHILGDLLKLFLTLQALMLRHCWQWHSRHSSNTKWDQKDMRDKPKECSCNCHPLPFSSTEFQSSLTHESV